MVMMMNNPLEAHYRQIEAAMVETQRKSWRGISPNEVLACLAIHVPEKQIRGDMDELVGMGRLVKVGRGAGRGYRLATRAQREAHLAKYGMRPRGEISVSWYTDLVYEEIEKAVAKACRDLGRGVFPRDVQPRLPYGASKRPDGTYEGGRAEGSLRRDMLAMWAAGRLVRVGGQGARRGYRLPSRMEKLAYTLNRGMWPHGTEFVVSWAN